MYKMYKSWATVFLVMAVGTCSAWAQQTVPPVMVQKIPLPGVEGRIDHLAVDLKRQRLFVAALGNNTVEVLDLRAGKHLHRIGRLREPQGVAYAPELNRIFVGNGGGGTCEIFDGGSFDLIQSVHGLDDADNVRYDAAAGKVYVGYGRGALGILEAASGKRAGDIRLAGHPESFQLEKSGPRIFVNVPGAGQVAVADRAGGAQVAIWPLKGAAANFPMALDETNHRLFVGCRKPPRLLVYDTTSGKPAASLEIASDVDDLFYDAPAKRIYASCGEGLISVLEQQDADHYRALARIPTAAGARTGLFVPEWGRFYLAVPHRGAQRAEIRVYSTRPHRPAVSAAPALAR